MELPREYQLRMQRLLGEEYPAYRDSLAEERVRSLRVNTAKISAEELARRLPFLDGGVAWCPEGYYIKENRDFPEKEREAAVANPARHPYYAAGLYYLQEASAMAPGAILPVEPGDRVLDLCGAPGGKSTQLGARLCGSGLLVANDLSASRAQAMVKNLELFGIANCMVTAESPEKLAAAYPEAFHKILVDAPCSGEGMFRRDPSLIRDWERRGPSYYQGVQRQILEQAVQMLRPGGLLLYSTCTFSPEEDEENIRWLLERFPELSLATPEPAHGISPGQMPGTLRIWPQRVRGEGHFLALLQKEERGCCAASDGGFSAPDGGRLVNGAPHSRPLAEAAPDLAGLLAGKWQQLLVTEERDCLYVLPEGLTRKAGIRYLRTGLLLGNRKKGRTEPSQALAMALRKEAVLSWVDYPSEDGRVIRYLKGETVTCDGVPRVGEDGWTLVCTDGFPLGWAKRNKDTLKNKYNPGWRWQ